jgi:putative salt-induced outer membrane protein YdiY
MKTRILLLASLLALGPLFSVTHAQINMERFRRATQKKGLEGNADFDFTIMTGNTDFSLVGLNSRLNYNWGKSYTFLVLNGSIGWNMGERFMDQNMAHLRHVLALTSRLQNEWFVQFDSNRKRLLSGRELFGVGLRAKVVTTRLAKLRVGAAYMYEYERYDLAAGNSHPDRVKAHRLSSYATLEVGQEKGFSLLNVTYFQPALADWRDNRILSENALTTDLTAFLALKVTFTMRYDTRPPDGIKKLDTISKTGLALKF